MTAPRSGPRACVDRRGNRHYVKVRPSKLRLFAREAQARMAEVRGVRVKRAIMAVSQLLDPGTINIETGHRDTRARKGDRDRQANIAESMTRFSCYVLTISLAPNVACPKNFATFPNSLFGIERVKGIEPSSSAWKAIALPLAAPANNAGTAIIIEQQACRF